jgi:hypothetical protein
MTPYPKQVSWRGQAKRAFTYSPLSTRHDLNQIARL